ncbi:MAG: helix-turn-helix domain-containing protein [Myxococcales bacterium]
MFVSPSFLKAIHSEIQSGRYALKPQARLPGVTGDGEPWLDSNGVDQFVTSVVRAFEDEGAGLLLGRRAPYTMLHVLGHLALECSTPREMFHVLQRYSGVLFEGISWHLAEGRARPGDATFPPGADLVELGFRFDARVSEATDRFWSEWLLCMLTRFARELYGASQLAVGCAHARPRYEPAYDDAFGCSVKFDECSYWLRFTVSHVSREPMGDANLFCVLRDVAERSLRERTTSRTFAERVRDVLQRQPDMTHVDPRRLAKLLGTTQRMLRRRLQEEGQTVSSLMNELRCDLAKRALLEGDESMKEIADRLGYSEPSAFHRAFRRWTGQTPARFRGAGVVSKLHSGGGVMRPTRPLGSWMKPAQMEPSGPNAGAPRYSLTNKLSPGMAGLPG